MLSKHRGIVIFLMAMILVMVSSASVFAATTKINNKTYRHPSFYKTKLHKLFHGVDVSYWQGNINWKKSKAAGIDFAIIRCGYTALSRFSLNQDSFFKKNITNAKKAGVSVGVYYYASATTKSEAKKEANYVISLLKNNKVNPQLPVVMDYEFGQGRANNNYNYLVRKKGKAYARKVYTNNAKAFMNQIKAAGYETMFYSYRGLIDKNFSANYRFNMSEINGSRQYRFWLAQYSSDISYKGAMEIWQFSSTGRVNGMKGNIDRNFWYYPLSGIEGDPGTKSIRKATVKLNGTKQKYDGTAKEPEVTVKYNGKKLAEDSDYAVSYMNNIKKGTATVLIHGKGDYSNEAFTTFTIGDVSNASKVKSSKAYDNSNGGNSKEEEKKEELKTPDKVTELTATGSEDNKSLALTWKKADDATRYRIAYKVNGASKWTKKVTKKLTYTIGDLKRNQVVELKVRAENADGKEVKSGKYSSPLYRYMRSSNGSAEIKKGTKVKVTWKRQKDKKGKMRYQVMSDCIYVKLSKHLTSKLQMVLSGTEKYSYTVWVRPVLIYNGKKYYGSDHGNKTSIYLMTSEITKTASLKKGFAIRYSKAEGIGDPKYDITYSRYKDFRKAKTVTAPQNKTRKVIKKLKTGTTYYVKVQPYKVLNGIEFRGVTSKVAKIKTK